LWRRASELRIPVCVLTNFQQVPRLAGVLERHPDLPIALDHIGMPRLDDGPHFEDEQPLFDLARFPNFYGKFSSWTIAAAAKNGKRGCAEFFRRLNRCVRAAAPDVGGRTSRQATSALIKGSSTSQKSN